MLPLFKSHFSIGKSILTLENIFDLGKNLDQVILIEDSLASLRKANKKAKDSNLKLRYGLRIDAAEESNPSKVIFLAKNDEGIRELRYIYTEAFTKNEGVFEIGSVKFNNLLTCIPFYDSFVHKNLHFFGSHGFSDKFLDSAVFLEEDNLHPFDYQIKRALKKFTDKTLLVKSIYYKERSQFPSFQNYKAACNRRTGGKQPTIDNPNIDDLSSDRFCWEDYKNYGRD